MDKLTERIYTDYKNQINLEGMTHSVQYEMRTALLNKVLNDFWRVLQKAIADGQPERIIKLYQAKADAMIAIITDLSVVGIELFLQEPDSIAYEPEEPDGIE